MAATDQQLEYIVKIAGRLGKALNPVTVKYLTDATIISLVFGEVESLNLRTEDEYDAIITEDDFPAAEDLHDIVNAFLGQDS